jgi:hypothetical protein
LGGPLAGKWYGMAGVDGGKCDEKVMGGVEEQNASAKAGPSTSLFAKCANNFAQDDTSFTKVDRMKRRLRG